MCSRIPIRRMFPSAFQLTKIMSTPARFSKTPVSYFNVNVNTYAGSTMSSVRLYSEQVDPETMTVDYDYVKKATSDQKVLIVDVREPDEVKEHGKIPSSINIPLGNVAAILSTMPENEFSKTYQKSKPSEETEIIFYCMIGKRSGMAQQNALNLGYRNAKNYLGSWTDWGSKQAS